DLGGGGFEQAECVDHLARDRPAADREVLHRPLGAGAPEGRGRDLHLAHRVAFVAGIHACLLSAIRAILGTCRSAGPASRSSASSALNLFSTQRTRRGAEGRITRRTPCAILKGPRFSPGTPGTPPMPAFTYEPTFQYGTDTTPYRLLTKEGVSVVHAAGRDFL